MMNFKFFQSPKKERVFSDYMDMMDDYHLGGIERNVVANDIRNNYLNHNMDFALVKVLKFIRHHNQSILFNDISLERVNIPIHNCWLRITDWRNRPGAWNIIDISYTIIESNTTPRQFRTSFDANSLYSLLDTP